MDDSVLLIYGCGTQGSAIVEWIACDGAGRPLKLTDDNPVLWGQEFSGYTVSSPEEAMRDGNGEALCAIGDNTVRWKVLLRLREGGYSWARWLHSTATVAPSAVVGAGSIVMTQAVLDVESRVGRGCLINTGSVVSHHCTLGDAVHLAPGVKLGGGVRIGDGAFLGLGAVVLPGVRIGAKAVVGAGAVVLRHVADGDVVVGNPAVPLYAKRPSKRASLTHPMET